MDRRAEAVCAAAIAAPGRYLVLLTSVAIALALPWPPTQFLVLAFGSAWCLAGILTDPAARHAAAATDDSGPSPD